MVKIDLVTGFLGSGKTTFIKRYADYLMGRGERICILENDYGAVNVDMLFMNELRGENCELEMVAGGCDADCHKRRFKTKLIAMAMSGYDRVIVEPSGIFDVDEFFDVLYEEPLDSWYETGNVIAVVDAGLEEELSAQSEYLLASQAACAGRIIMSHMEETSGEELAGTKAHLQRALEALKWPKDIGKKMICKDWKELTGEDFEEIAHCGYEQAAYVKMPLDQEVGFQSLYFMNLKMPKEEFGKMAKALLREPSCGKIFRIKGFMENGEAGWLQMNATAKKIDIRPIAKGQDVFIVIGEKLNGEKIGKIIEAFDRKTKL